MKHHHDPKVGLSHGEARDANNLVGEACVTAPAGGTMRQCKLRLMILRSGTVPPGSGLCELRTLMAVPGRRTLVPTRAIRVSSRDGPLPWASGMLTTPRVLSRDLWVSAPALDPPNSDMLYVVLMGAWPYVPLPDVEPPPAQW